MPDVTSTINCNHSTVKSRQNHLRNFSFCPQVSCNEILIQMKASLSLKLAGISLIFSWLHSWTTPAHTFIPFLTRVLAFSRQLFLGKIFKQTNLFDTRPLSSYFIQSISVFFPPSSGRKIFTFYYLYGRVSMAFRVGWMFVESIDIDKLIMISLQKGRKLEDMKWHRNSVIDWEQFFLLL
jgi:hypothetical protein